MSKGFSASIEMGHRILILQFVSVVYHTAWFVDTEKSLRPFPTVPHLRSSPTVTQLTKQALLRSTQNRLGILHVLLKFPFCSYSQQLSHLIVSVCLSLAIPLDKILLRPGCDYTLTVLNLKKWKWSRVRLFATPWAVCPWDFPGNSPGVDCHFLLQGIFPTQGLNPGLPHCRQTL